MNVDLTSILQIVGTISWIPITAWGIYTSRKMFGMATKIKEELYDFTDELVGKAKAYYLNERDMFIKAAPDLIQGSFGPQIKSAMSILGQNSGVSRQMKGLERDLISDGIDSQIPGAGPLIAKYAQKYPILLTLAQQYGPALMKGMGGGQGNDGQGSSDGNNPFR